MGMHERRGAWEMSMGDGGDLDNDGCPATGETKLYLTRRVSERGTPICS